MLAPLHVLMNLHCLGYLPAQRGGCRNVTIIKAGSRGVPSYDRENRQLVTTEPVEFEK